jgi:hypothetical protein
MDVAAPKARRSTETSLLQILQLTFWVSRELDTNRSYI